MYIYIYIHTHTHPYLDIHASIYLSICTPDEVLKVSCNAESLSDSKFDLLRYLSAF